MSQTNLVKQFSHIEEKQSGQSHVATDSDSGESVPNLLDHYCKEKKVNFVDFAKVDLEGHELPALKGWRKDLSEHKVRAIYIEIMPENPGSIWKTDECSLAFL